MVANPRNPGRDQRLISVYQFVLKLVVLIEDANSGARDYKDLKPFCFVCVRSHQQTSIARSKDFMPIDTDHLESTQRLLHHNQGLWSSRSLIEAISLTRHDYRMIEWRSSFLDFEFN